MNEDKMPLFLINGFLEAGKTQFIKFTMQQDYFQTEGKTLLIVCEEGEEEYDEELLKQTHTAVVYIEEAEKLTPEYLQDLELLYNPERVLMEWNGMWNLDALKLPNDWDLYQQITIIPAEHETIDWCHGPQHGNDYHEPLRRDRGSGCIPPYFKGHEPAGSDRI